MAHSSTIKVSDASFQTDVLEASKQKPVLVDFWADWCGPCHMIAPILEEVAAAHPDKITIAKHNVDEQPKMAQAYEVMSIPNMVVFVDGKPAKRIIGAKPKAALLADLAEFLK